MHNMTLLSTGNGVHTNTEGRGVGTWGMRAKDGGLLRIDVGQRADLGGTKDMTAPWTKGDPKSSWQPRETRKACDHLRWGQLKLTYGREMEGMPTCGWGGHRDRDSGEGGPVVLITHGLALRV